MLEPSAFAEVIVAVREELLAGATTPLQLNQAASRIDHLGRQLHGMGMVRDHAIGVCLTAAVAELGQARDRVDGDGGGLVERAILQLDTALSHADVGVLPATGR